MIHFFFHPLGSITTDNRKLWLDALRGIAMLLVVYGHCVKGWTEYYIFSSPIKMPLFFLISGYLFKPRGGDQRAFFKGVFFRLVIPWVVLGIIHHTNPATRFLNLLSGKALWFMPCFIIAEIVWFYVHKLAKRDGLIVVSGLVLSGVGLLLAHHHLLRYAMVNTALVVQAFFVLGFLMRKYEEVLDRSWKVWTAAAVVVYVALGVYVVTCGTGRPLDVHLNRYPNLVLSMLTIVVGCLAIFTLFRKLNVAPRWLVYIGQNTLPIYILHGIVLFLFNKYGTRIGLDTSWPLALLALLKTTVACLMCCAFAALANRYLPELVGKKRAHNKNN
jgi:fucose 4-O-acetylase-like acetyltransferase